MPKITINDQTVEVPNGWMVIQAAQKLNIPIAHYCWHEGLSIAGACRMCMVEVEKMPKLQVACNTPITDGMIVRTDTEKVKDAVKWALDFHLINHPLDCPICDQAGECKLQDYYMTYGLYTPEMNQDKVKKEKVIGLGDRVVLDQERCILCSRCVRFTSEVSKTHELGIFNRGDRSVIGTFENRPLNNNYSVNTVDICPVGALTSKDFRFKQRVWFLKEFDSVCNRCSTGCNVTVSYNQNGVFRVKPKVNHEVNGFWMCDLGRDVYKHTNKEYRLDQVVEKNHELGGASVKGKPVAQAIQEIAKSMKNHISQHGSESVAIVLTAQYTVEELETFVEFFSQKLKVNRFYYWKNNEESFDAFDGLLLRGDKNPNTNGLMKVMSQHKIKGSWQDFEKAVASGEIKMTVVAGPEDQEVYSDLEAKLPVFKKAGEMVWLTSCKNEKFNDFKWQIPMKSFVEKEGTFVNFKGIEQKIKAGVKIIPSAISLKEVAAGLKESMGVAQ
ncbi:MAG: 2Fe-2S iron-sulfur cluster-binding protein [Oligoflexia bacterium]|nr:2Fe-2S iron-sulfur cluster-binding protein [Oligoflexia bacterium]